jgi:abhydrolase domain-containing protein 13
MGEPTHKGIQEDLLRTLEYMRAQSLAAGDVYVFGQSLGGAVALDLFAKRSDWLAGVILENTFTSLKQVMRDHTFWPLRAFLETLMTELWDNELSVWAARSFAGKRVLLLSGRQDTFIEPWHMDRLEYLLRQRMNSGGPDAGDSPAAHLQVSHIPNGLHIEMHGEAEYVEAFRHFFR